MCIAKIGDLNSLAYRTYNRNQRVLDNMTMHMVYSQSQKLLFEYVGEPDRGGKSDELLWLSLFAI